MSAPSNYAVGPTSQDITNAYSYAYNKIAKEICEAPENKGLYKWVDNKIVPFPCPFGLNCVSGMCKYTEEGCKAASSGNPMFECKRKTVPCFLDGQDGQCEVCDYHIQDTKVYGPYLPEEYDAVVRQIPGCAPGDQKYLTTDDPVADAASEQEDPTDNYQCQGMLFDPEPYKLNGSTITCETSDDCAGYAGGACMLYEYNIDPVTKQKLGKKKAYKQCYDPKRGYLEYRKNFTQWDGYPGEDTCILTFPVFRNWCEMPWARPPEEDEDMTVSMATRIEKHPQTKKHPPFYYDEYSGRCFVTKDYCTKSIPDGGFDTGFGKQEEYITGVLEGCSNPGHNNAQVRQGYDCCTPLGSSIGQFFFGRTFITLLQDVFSGDISLYDFMKQANDFGLPAPWNTIMGGAGMAAIVYFLSEDRVKDNKRLVAYDFVAPNVNLYEFTWSPEVRARYPRESFAPGPRLGLLASEVQRLYPDIVYTNEYGDRTIAYDHDKFANDAVYRNIVLLLFIFDVAGSSSNLSHIRL